MLILAGPVKVDLIFAEPHDLLPPWQVAAATLPGIDDHFWDWLLWLSAKQAPANTILSRPNSPSCTRTCSPLGVPAVPATPGQAIVGYEAARNGWQQRLRRRVSRAAEQAVRPALS
jgi:hypothetical protein